MVKSSGAGLLYGFAIGAVAGLTLGPVGMMVGGSAGVVLGEVAEVLYLRRRSSRNGAPPSHS